MCHTMQELEEQIKQGSIDEETKAIEGSVQKWDLIAQGMGLNEGASNCPLCTLYVDNPHCHGCPVVGGYHMIGCNSTPYAEILIPHNMTVPAWIKVMQKGSLYQFRQIITDTLEAIEEKIEFLVSLLPDGHKIRQELEYTLDYG